MVDFFRCQFSFTKKCHKSKSVDIFRCQVVEAKRLLVWALTGKPSSESFTESRSAAAAEKREKKKKKQQRKEKKEKKKQKPENLKLSVSWSVGVYCQIGTLQKEAEKKKSLKVTKKKVNKQEKNQLTMVRWWFFYFLDVWQNWPKLWGSFYIYFAIPQMAPKTSLFSQYSRDQYYQYGVLKIANHDNNDWELGLPRKSVVEPFFIKLSAISLYCHLTPSSLPHALKSVISRLYSGFIFNLKFIFSPPL